MRAAVTVIFFGALVALGGCPSNTGDTGCYLDRDCGDGYLCEQSTGICRVAPASVSCNEPNDCAPTYTCGKEGRCLPGDCYFHECVAGYQCQSSTGQWLCLPVSGGAAGAGGEEGGQAGAAGALEAAGQGGAAGAPEAAGQGG